MCNSARCKFPTLMCVCAFVWRAAHSHTHMCDREAASRHARCAQLARSRVQSWQCNKGKLALSQQHACEIMSKSKVKPGRKPPQCHKGGGHATMQMLQCRRWTCRGQRVKTVLNIILTNTNKWVAQMAKPNWRTPNVDDWVAQMAKPKWRNKWRNSLVTGVWAGLMINCWARTRPDMLRRGF